VKTTLNRVILLTSALSAYACAPIPIPHSSITAPPISGRVLDASSHRPVSGAAVVLRDLPETSTSTDSAGRFTTRLSRSTHIFGVYAYDDSWRLQVPPPHRTDGKLIVTHEGYRRAEVHAGDFLPQPFQTARSVDTISIPDILLQRLTQ